MATPIIMPKFGQMTEESAIIEWLKKEGDKIDKGDILFTVETDKSIMEVESFEAGTLLKILVQPGVNVPVQSPVGYLGKLGEDIPSPSTSAPSAAKPAAPRLDPAVPRVPSTPQPKTTQRTMTSTLPATAPAPSSLFRISPRAAVLAKECVIDPTPIKGSGPEGRIVERDVKQYLDLR
ncbi:MAG: E3 binding domain-containing protein, partial [Verrucomicrobia bacterium]|nr:E3 binding domain-containing protein [Verrucomicrobiota bacterium]